MSKRHSFEFLLRRIGVELRSTGQLSARLMLFAIALCSTSASAQQTANQTDSAPVPSLTEAVRELSNQVRALQTSVAEMRSESEQARAETRELRREVEELRAGTSDRQAVVMQAVARTENSVGTMP